MNRMLAWPLCWCVGIGIAASLAAERAPDDSLEFVRVTVPAERLRDVPLDGGRLVPMPLADFDRAVARLMPDAEGRAPRPLADEARYVLAADERGRLSGRLEFDLGALATAIGGAVPLGGLWVERAVLRSDEGVGEAVVFSRGGSGAAMVIAVVVVMKGVRTLKTEICLRASGGTAQEKSPFAILPAKKKIYAHIIIMRMYAYALS
jgi:hypothetical protein